MFVFKRNQIIITALVFMVAIAAYLNFTDTQNMVQPTFDEESPALTQNEDGTYKDYFAKQNSSEINTLAPDIDSISENEMASEDTIIIDNAMGAEDEIQLEEEIALIEEQTSNEKTNNMNSTLKNKVIEENKNAQGNIEDSEVVMASNNYDVNYFIEAKMEREQKRAEQIEILTECVNNKEIDKESKAGAAQNLITLQERIEKESAIESLLKAKGFKEVYVRISDDDVDVVVNKQKLEQADIAQIEDIVRRKTGYSASQIKISPLKN